MTLFDIPVIDIAYAFFILVPGFVTYRVGKYRGKVTANVDSFNKTSYTLIASGVSLSILIIGYSALTGTSPTSVVTADYGIGQLGVAYVLLLGISTVNGYLSGYAIDKWVHAGVKTRRERVWDLAMDNSEQPIECQVITAAGEEIHGYIYLYDANDHGKDVLLQYPEKIIREDGEIVERKSIGEYVYVNEDKTSHIYMETEINV